MRQVLDVVIVNWNSGERLREVVASIAENDDGLVRAVIVVDNASSDMSVTALGSLRPSLPFSLQVIANSRNSGFAAACNQGGSLATADYVLFLNPDTKIFPRSLCRSLSFLSDAENGRVGIVGIQLIDEDARVSTSCSRFPTLGSFVIQAIGINRLKRFRRLSCAMLEWDHSSTREVDQVMGAFFLVRRRVFSLLGGFDERFFVYFEEVDFSQRARDLGWISMFLADAKCFHEGGGTSRQVKPHRLFYSLRSRVLYGFKHFSAWKAWSLLIVTVFIEPLTRALASLLAGQGLFDTWRGYVMLYCDLPNILRTALRS